uniref:Uncharacterized protein n=1 Tax=Ralstonia solanacearum TaxID=305 RepID=A0A0S4WE10_RALSL|nr:protein of unknown function [Ralstonia solanacearum]
MLRPYPAVEIVLTTSWLQTLPVDTVISFLPSELAQRVRVLNEMRAASPIIGHALHASVTIAATPSGMSSKTGRQAFSRTSSEPIFNLYLLIHNR